MKTWIMVASAAYAKMLFTDNLRTKDLELIKELNHPESRKKTSELATDKPGSYRSGAGFHGAFDQTKPKDTEHEHFAMILAEEINNAYNKKSFQKLLIVAPAHFQSLVTKHLHKMVDIDITSLAKDYTKYNLKETRDRLEEQLFG